jgi:WD40 repeat protein
VHRGVSLIDIDGSRLIGALDFYSAASAAAFAPGGDDLVVGMHNGGVQVCRIGGNQVRHSHRLEPHAGKVVTIASVPDRKLLVTAATDGRMRAYAWPSGNLIGELQVGILKSVTVSPHGDWLAMGHEDVTTLWDFRVADIPSLFALPLVDTTPAHLGLLESAVSGLSSKARKPCLETLTAMLRYRFRHDIEIDDSAVAIRAGRFDIELG